MLPMDTYNIEILTFPATENDPAYGRRSDVRTLSAGKRYLARTDNSSGVQHDWDASVSDA